MNENIWLGLALTLFYIGVFSQSLSTLAAFPDHNIAVICCVLQESRKVRSAPSVKMTGRWGWPSCCCTCSAPSSPSLWLSWDIKVVTHSCMLLMISAHQMCNEICSPDGESALSHCKCFVLGCVNAFVKPLTQEFSSVDLRSSVSYQLRIFAVYKLQCCTSSN